MNKYFIFIFLISISFLKAQVQQTRNIHKNDYKWIQFNYMYSIDEMPREKNADNKHDYLEIEFGGRSGIFQLYGYVDVFNLTNRRDSDKSISQAPDKIFIKFAPRISINNLIFKNLQIGYFKEFYLAVLFNCSGNNGGVNNFFCGIGSDIKVPWLGKIGLNVYSLYDLNQKHWNGYQVSGNWFKPFYHFKNESFLSYQGYLDYQLGMKQDLGASSDNGGAMFNGFYWHSNRFAVGFGLKVYKDVYGIKNNIQIAAPSVQLESTGISHYLSFSYKF